MSKISVDVDTVDLKDIIAPAKATTQYYKFKITFEKLRKLSSTLLHSWICQLIVNS